MKKLYSPVTMEPTWSQVDWKSAFRDKKEAGIQEDTVWDKLEIRWTPPSGAKFFSVPGYFYSVTSEVVHEITPDGRVTTYEGKPWELDVVYLDQHLYVPHHDEFYYKSWTVFPGRKEVSCLPPHPDGIEIKGSHYSIRSFICKPKQGPGVIHVIPGNHRALLFFKNTSKKNYHFSLSKKDKRFLSWDSENFFAEKQYQLSSEKNISVTNLHSCYDRDGEFNPKLRKEIFPKSLTGLKILETTSSGPKIYLLCSTPDSSVVIVSPRI